MLNNDQLDRLKQIISTAGTEAVEKIIETLEEDMEETRMLIEDGPESVMQAEYLLKMEDDFGFLDGVREGL